MALTKAAQRDKQMLELLKRWTRLEDSTIRSCANISKKTKNPLIKTLVTAIKNDSAKHKAIIKLIIDSMTKRAIVLTPDDIRGVSHLLDKHIMIEEKSITTAHKAIEISRDSTVKQLLRLILEDEKKHAKLAEQMNELKFRVTARVT
jgi:rubrerythrin